MLSFSRISLHLGHAVCIISQFSMRTYRTIENSTWTNVAIFSLANFIARAATVKFVPGESALSAFVAPVFILLLPASSNFRGLFAVYQRAVFADTPLKTAARAKALCMVVRMSEWKPQTGTSLKHVTTRKDHYKQVRFFYKLVEEMLIKRYSTIYIEAAFRCRKEIRKSK